MSRRRRQTRINWRTWRWDGTEGIDFVRCRICGDHRRVISGRHLSKHGTDREEYMEEYGLAADELIAREFRTQRSSRPDFYPYGKREWIDGIQKIYKREGKIFAGYLQDKYPPIYNQGPWLFGDWDTALRAAGFDPEGMRLRTLWDQRRVIKEIRRMRNQHLPLNAYYAMKYHNSLLHAAVKQFGSWSKALLEAGISKKQVSGKLQSSRLVVLRALRDALEDHSTRDIPQALALQAVHYFGSLRNAIIAMKRDPRVLGGWSERKITTILSEMHRLKKTLSHTKVQRENQALVSAAEAYFGSWRKALRAAGIDAREYDLRVQRHLSARPPRRRQTVKRFGENER